MRYSRRSGVIRVPLALAGVGLALGFFGAHPRVRDPDRFSPAAAAAAEEAAGGVRPLPAFPTFPPPVLPDRLPRADEAADVEARPFPSLRDFPGLLDALSTPSRSFPLDVVNAAFGIPEAVMDCAVSFAETIQPEADGSTWTRIVRFQAAAPRSGLAERFFDLAMEREQRFFAGFADGELAEFDTAEGSSDEHYLRQKQRKIVAEALRRTYTEKYRLSADDRIRDEAFRIDRWTGLDYVVLPPLLAGYLYYRGIDKKFSAGSTWIRVSVEAIDDLLHEDAVRCAFNVQWVPKDFPVGLILSVGFDDGEAALDFVGIGTSVDIVRKALGEREDHGIRSR